MNPFNEGVKPQPSDISRSIHALRLSIRAFVWDRLIEQEIDPRVGLGRVVIEAVETGLYIEAGVGPRRSHEARLGRRMDGLSEEERARVIGLAGSLYRGYKSSLGFSPDDPLDYAEAGEREKLREQARNKERMEASEKSGRRAALKKALLRNIERMRRLPANDDEFRRERSNERIDFTSFDFFEQSDGVTRNRIRARQMTEQQYNALIRVIAERNTPALRDNYTIANYVTNHGRELAPDAAWNIFLRHYVTYRGEDFVYSGEPAIARARAATFGALAAAMRWSIRTSSEIRFMSGSLFLSIAQAHLKQLIQYLEETQQGIRVFATEEVRQQTIDRTRRQIGFLTKFSSSLEPALARYGEQIPHGQQYREILKALLFIRGDKNRDRRNRILNFLKQGKIVEAHAEI